ncbi:hypothetical protein GCM10020219_017140 [Nonomuraea dietziae]
MTWAWVVTSSRPITSNHWLPPTLRMGGAQVLGGVLQDRQILPDVLGRLQRALVARHTGRLDALDLPHVVGQVEQVLKGPAPGPAAFVTHLHQHPEGPRARVLREQVHARARVDEAEELEGGVGRQLRRGPVEPGGVDDLVGDDDPGDPEAAHDHRLARRGDRHPPRARVELHSGDLGGHVGLGVGREEHAVVAGEGGHRGDVVLERVALHDHQREAERPAEHVLSENFRS